MPIHTYPRADNFWGTFFHVFGLPLEAFLKLSYVTMGDHYNVRGLIVYGVG